MKKLIFPLIMFIFFSCQKEVDKKEILKNSIFNQIDFPDYTENYLKVKDLKQIHATPGINYPKYGLDHIVNYSLVSCKHLAPDRGIHNKSIVFKFTGIGKRKLKIIEKDEEYEKYPEDSLLMVSLDSISITINIEAPSYIVFSETEHPFSSNRYYIKNFTKNDLDFLCENNNHYCNPSEGFSLEPYKIIISNENKLDTIQNKPSDKYYMFKYRCSLSNLSRNEKAYLNIKKINDEYEIIYNGISQVALWQLHYKGKIPLNQKF